MEDSPPVDSCENNVTFAESNRFEDRGNLDSLSGFDDRGHRIPPFAVLDGLSVFEFVDDIHWRLDGESDPDFLSPLGREGRAAIH